MRAAIITRFGGPEALEVRDVAPPRPGNRQILVRVRASALNRADLLQRQGRYPPPNDVPRDIPGIEFAGEVADAGPAAHRWQTGDRVFGIVGGGAHAEYLVTHEDAVARIPDSLAWRDAGAAPEAFITAWDAMVTQAGLGAGESVLIHAVGSGVGLAAVHVARAVGAVPYGVSRHESKVQGARAQGLEDGIALAHGPEGLVPFAQRVTTGRGVDVVMDLVGGAWTGAALDVLALRGRLMVVGTVAGTQASVDLRRVLGRRLTIRGTVLRARSLEEKIDVTRTFERDVVPLLASGMLRPMIDRTFDLGAIAEAHRHLESNDTFGKVVLDV